MAVKPYDWLQVDTLAAENGGLRTTTLPTILTEKQVQGIVSTFVLYRKFFVFLTNDCASLLFLLLSAEYRSGIGRSQQKCVCPLPQQQKPQYEQQCSASRMGCRVSRSGARRQCFERCETAAPHRWSVARIASTLTRRTRLKRRG